MKNIFVAFAFLIFAGNASAKKIKFAVDMTGQEINPNGVHLAGDFQTLAGYTGGDFNSSSTTLTKVGTTDIYSIVLDLPAFRKYEYYFVNGIESYQAEFVKDQSRVGYDFNANRWLFLDSLASDTFSVGAIQFGENAPAGMKLVRFMVDMTNVSSFGNGYVSGNYNSWSYPKGRLYSFGANVYEIIQYVPTGNYEYNFGISGGTSVAPESVPAFCTGGMGHRSVSVITDTVLTTVCFGSCSACVTAISTLSKGQNVVVAYPNPTQNLAFSLSLNGSEKNVEVYSTSGQRITSIPAVTKENLPIVLPQSGIYLVKVCSKDGSVKTIRVTAL